LPLSVVHCDVTFFSSTYFLLDSFGQDPSACQNRTCPE
jgi:hypothetical protein